MAGFNKVHRWVGVAIVLLVVIFGCCFLNFVVGMPGPYAPQRGYGYGPTFPGVRLFPFDAFGLVRTLIGLVVLLAVVVVILAIVLWILRRLREGGRRR